MACEFYLNFEKQATVTEMLSMGEEMLWMVQAPGPVAILTNIQEAAQSQRCQTAVKTVGNGGETILLPWVGRDSWRQPSSYLTVGSEIPTLSGNDFIWW